MAYGLFCFKLFENGEQCSKEDNITDWNSPPIYDKYLDEDCELFLRRTIVEDDDQSLFSQGEAITHTNDENFIVQIQKVTHFTEDNCLEIGDFIWEGFMQRELIRMGLSFTIQQLSKEVNLGSIHEYGDLFPTWASCATPWQNKLQIRIRSTRFVMSEKRLMSSMLVALVLLNQRGWKGLTGNPIDRGKDDFKHEIGVLFGERLHSSFICQATMVSPQLSMYGF
jgi:hypothetical protein